MRLRRFPLWPGSLAARTALVLVLGLAVVQLAGLAMHEADRRTAAQAAQLRDAALRMGAAYRSVVLAAPGDSADVIGAFDRRDGLRIWIADQPAGTVWPLLPPAEQQAFRQQMAVVPVPPSLRPRAVELRRGAGHLAVALRLPDNRWLDADLSLELLRSWRSLDFLSVFLIMTIVTAGLTWWAARRLIAPVATLAAAAEALGRDVNAPPLPESGAVEIVAAARAFNTMAARLRRFVRDRTFMLLAIGHDLRTPITRLRLRAEFLEDEVLREKLLADLDEMEKMVASALAFGRESDTDEPVVAVDLAELARTVLDEAADARPQCAARLRYVGPAHVTVRVRSLAAKRALANLVLNAITYGGSATVRLLPPSPPGPLVLLVEDDGPGIPVSELERVFQPFQRLEGSRNRETGGAGLGLAIVRNIFRAHGGDVTLENRAEGGLRARIVLPT